MSDIKNKFLIEIHNILINDWDPAHVRDNKDAQNEYDPFLEVIYELLQDQASEEQIFEQLEMIAIENLGEKRTDELDERTRQVAHKIKTLKILVQ